MNRRDREFQYKLAWINALGLILIVVGPLIIDPRLKHHIDYTVPNNRTYGAIRWLWLLTSVPIWLATYHLKLARKSRILTVVYSVSILVLPAFLIAFLFPPERPHAGILVWTFAYGFVTLFTVFFHAGRTDMRLADDPGNEWHKAMISWWKQITLYAAAGYLAFAIFLASVAWTINAVIVTDQRERFFFGNAQMIQILTYSVFIIAGPLYEAFQTTEHYINELRQSRNGKTVRTGG